MGVDPCLGGEIVLPINRDTQPIGQLEPVDVVFLGFTLGFRRTQPQRRKEARHRKMKRIFMQRA